MAKLPPSVEIPYNELDDVSETDLSLASILRGTATKPLTSFEKKAALINLELDKFGLGRYQWCIWFLCGFGYFLDLAWSQGVGLISTAIYQEMGVADEDTGNIFAIANAGLAVGALVFGLAVDVIGRKWAFNLTCLITSVFGLLLVSLPIELTTKLTKTGRAKVQLRRHLRHLLSRVARPRRQHPDRRDHRARVPAAEPAVPRRPAVDVAADRRDGGVWHRVRHGGKVAVRSRAAELPRRLWRRGLLHSREQHGLAVQRDRARGDDAARVLFAVLCVYLLRVAKVSAEQRQRGGGD
jgi:hypothetical protein